MFKLSHLTDDELLNKMHHSENEIIQEIATRLVSPNIIDHDYDSGYEDGYREGYEAAQAELIQ